MLNNHIEMVKLLLAKGAVSPKEDKINLLLIAASSRQCEIWLMLSDTKPPSGTDLLISLDSAALNGHEQMVQMLLNSGVVLIYDFNPKSKGITSAKRRGHESIVQQISSHVSRRRENHTAYAGGLLRNAVIDGNASKLRLIKSRFSMTDYDYSAGLCTAAQNGHEELVRILLLWIPDLNHLHDRCTALQDAVFHGHESVAQLLIDWGFNVNAKTPSGETLLLRAVTDKSERMIRFLLDRGADVNMTDQKGESALYYAVRTNDIGSIRLLLDYGAGVNARVDTNARALASGLTPLEQAVILGNTALTELFLEKGANIFEVGPLPRTLLDISAESGNVSMTRLLLKYGARRSGITQDGETLLHRLAIRNRWEIIELLVKVSVDISASAKDGWTPLHAAAALGNWKSVQVLLENGATVASQTVLGETALQLAASHGHQETVLVLLDKGADVLELFGKGI